MKHFQKVKHWIITKKIVSTITYFYSILAMLLISSRLPAQEAAGSFPFAPTQDDLSVKLIGKIFGGLAELVGATNGGNPFGDAITAFNGAVLTVGGILAAYTIFAGTVGTAHDGEMMGKKFSSAWVPMRTALGSALVLPVFAGGYCTMQAIVMWLIFQGVGLADETWKMYVASSSKGGGIYQTIPVLPDIQTLTNNVLLASVCTKAMAFEAAKVGDTELIAKNWGIKKDKSRNTINFGVLDQSDYQKRVCGSVFFGNKDGTKTIDSSDINNLISVGSTRKIADAHELATEVLIASIQPLAEKIIANVAVAPSELDAISTAYQKTVLETSQNIQKDAGLNPFDDIAKSSENQGWFVAGAWYMKIVQASNKIASAIQAVPMSSSASSQIDAKPSFFADAAPYLFAAEKVIGLTKAAQKSGITNNVESESGWTDSIFKKVTSGLGNSLAESMAGVNLSELNKNKKHPIIIMNNIGNALLTSALGMFSVVATIGFIAAPSLSGGTNVFIVLLPLLSIVGGALITSGFMLSYYIPMVPFLIWTGAVLGWVILVVEAIIAAPLWAVMHLHPHGDDLTGKGGGGYMLVLGLLIRPVLMIFGLIASLTIVQVFGEMLNNIYYDALNIANDGSIGFFGIIFGVVIYVALMTTFIHKSFSIIHIIPDQLLKWIGGGSEQLGQYAGDFNKSGQGASAAVGAIVGVQSGQTMGKMGAHLGTQKNGFNEEAKSNFGSKNNSQSASRRQQSKGQQSFEGSKEKRLRKEKQEKQRENNSNSTKNEDNEDVDEGLKFEQNYNEQNGEEPEYYGSAEQRAEEEQERRIQASIDAEQKKKNDALKAWWNSPAGQARIAEQNEEKKEAEKMKQQKNEKPKDAE